MPRKVKKRSTTIDTLESMRDNPQDVAENLGETAGGAQIPDPSDIPGGVFGLKNNMNQAAIKASRRSKIKVKTGRKQESERTKSGKK